MTSKGEKVRSAPYEAIVQAALQEAAGKGPAALRFSALIQLAKVPRATAYRLFPHGLDTLIEGLHRELVSQAVDRLKEQIRGAAEELYFRDTVRLGVDSLFETLSTARLTADLFGSDRDRLTMYLTSRTAGSLLLALAEYTARCASNYGSSAPETALDTASERFIFAILTELVRDLDRGPIETWPDPERLSEAIEQQMDRFLQDVGMDRASVERPKGKKGLLPLASVWTGAPVELAVLPC